MEKKKGLAINRLFAASVIRDIASNNSSGALKDVVPFLSGHDLDGMSVRDVFLWAQKKLSVDYRSEYFYKSVLIEKIVRGRHSPNTVAVYSEFRVGDSRADLVLVNGAAVAYEIKTDLDDLTRASKQAVEYFACFDSVVFVVDAKHVAASLNVLPEQVGLFCIGGRNRIKRIREPVRRLDLLSNQVMFSCLQRHEYESFLELEASGTVDANSYKEVLDFFCSVPTDRLHTYFVDCLRARKLRGKRIKEMHLLPAPLWAAAYTHKLNVSEWNGLISVLDRDLRDFI